MRIQVTSCHPPGHICSPSSQQGLHMPGEDPWCSRFQNLLGTWQEKWHWWGAPLNEFHSISIFNQEHHRFSTMVSICQYFPNNHTGCHAVNFG